MRAVEGGCLMPSAETFLSSKAVFERYLPNDATVADFNFETCQGSDCFKIGAGKTILEKNYCWTCNLLKINGKTAAKKVLIYNLRLFPFVACKTLSEQIRITWTLEFS